MMTEYLVAYNVERVPILQFYDDYKDATKMYCQVEQVGGSAVLAKIIKEVGCTNASD